MRGSQPTRATTSTVAAAASARRSGTGRALAIQAMPGTISASATVSQPFSSDMVSASASAATVPVACSAPAVMMVLVCSRFDSCSAAKPLIAARRSAKPAKGIERSKPEMR